MNKLQPARSRRVQDLLLIALLSIAIRVVALLCYDTLIGNDTPGFTKMAEAIRSWDAGQYDGYRTPGYPLFLVALGLNMEVIRVAHHLLGVLTALLVYQVVAMRLARPWALGAGLLYGLSLNFLFYEAIIMTEALANFLVLLILYTYLRRVDRGDFSCRGATWIAGLCTYLAMVRPQYLPVLPLLCFFEAVRIFRAPERRGRRLAGLLPGLGLYTGAFGGWILLNRILFGGYFLTLFSASAMMTHTIRFAEKAGPEWREAGEIMVKWREHYRVEIARDGTTEVAIYPAVTAICKAYAVEDPIARYQLLNRLNQHLIARSPADFARSVGIGCLNFWRISLILYPEMFERQELYRLFRALWWPNKAIWLALHVLFLFALLARLPRWRLVWRDTALSALLAYFLFAGMLFQALLSYSNSSRYALASESVILVALCYLLPAKWGRAGGGGGASPAGTA